jgi:hypothetical protein
MLGNHQHQRKVVHPECDIKELICVYKEDDILEGILNEVGVVL